MSRRQTERGSRFQVEIEEGVRLAAVKFRDNDVEASVNAAFRLWWVSRLRGRPFSHLIRQAREMTQARISLGRVEHGEPGQREAMPYFFAVLRELVEREIRAVEIRGILQRRSSGSTVTAYIVQGNSGSIALRRFFRSWRASANS